MMEQLVMVVGDVRMLLDLVDSVYWVVHLVHDGEETVVPSTVEEADQVLAELDALAKVYVEYDEEDSSIYLGRVA